MQQIYFPPYSILRFMQRVLWKIRSLLTPWCTSSVISSSITFSCPLQINVSGSVSVFLVVILLQVKSSHARKSELSEKRELIFWLQCAGRFSRSTRTTLLPTLGCQASVAAPTRIWRWNRAILTPVRTAVAVRWSAWTRCSFPRRSWWTVMTAHGGQGQTAGILHWRWICRTPTRQELCPCPQGSVEPIC